MKILERYDQTKTVEAWGETWTVPVWCMWMFIDGFGRVICCAGKPWEGNNRWHYSARSHEIAEVSGFGSWRESLVYVGDQ
jgi:hypothetical protein